MTFFVIISITHQQVFRNHQFQISNFSSMSTFFFRIINLKVETLTKKFLSEIIFTWQQRWISVSMLCWKNSVIVFMQLHTKLFGKKKSNLTTVPSTGRSLFYLVKLSWWSSSTKETFFALFCFSHIAHTLHFSSWQRMISDKRNLYSVFISCFSFCFPKYCFVSYEWYFTEKRSS